MGGGLGEGTRLVGAMLDEAQGNIIIILRKSVPGAVTESVKRGPRVWEIGSSFPKSN